MFSPLCVILALAGAAPAPPASLTADFDGAGNVETATARLRGKAIRVEIADAKGRRLASADAPAPAGADAASVAVSGGALGSSGTLLEVSAATAREECHSVFRFRAGVLARLPLQLDSRKLPDCAPLEGWTVRWERPAENAPAVRVRERTRESPAGLHQEREVFAFTGFALELDAARSSARIGDVSIPAWNEGVLYTQTALEILKSRFDLSKFRSAPRLTIEASRSRGVFTLHFKDGAGELAAPVTAVDAASNEIRLSVRTGERTTVVRASVRNHVVTEAVVSGLSPRFDAVYAPANRFAGGAIEIFARAEDEVASDMLEGLWASERGEQLALNLAPGALGVLTMRGSEVEVLLDSVPSGTDVLLVPRNGSPPAWALALRGANGLARVPVRCSGGKDAWSCELAGPAETFHRVGGRMNAR